jgi:hypothetical protein
VTICRNVLIYLCIAHTKEVSPSKVAYTFRPSLSMYDTPIATHYPSPFTPTLPQSTYLHITPVDLPPHYPVHLSPHYPSPLTPTLPQSTYPYITPVHLQSHYPVHLPPHYPSSLTPTLPQSIYTQITPLHLPS